MNKFAFIFTGLLSAIFGFGIIIRPKFYDSLYHHFYDFTEVKWPFGIFLVGFGGLLVWIGLRKKEKDFEEKIMICPKCEKTFKKNDSSEQLCPECKIPLEDLEGFYDRHPDLKE